MEYALLLFLAVAGGVFVRAWVVEPFRVPSNSMENTLLPGDFVLASKLRCRIRFASSTNRYRTKTAPKTGDIVVFKNPECVSGYVIKRCVATSGQVLEFRDDLVYVDGQLEAAPNFAKLGGWTRDPSSTHLLGPWRIPVGHFFALGDNRKDSRDSRYFGPVAVTQITGRAIIIYFSRAPRIQCSRSASIRCTRRIRWERIGRMIR